MQDPSVARVWDSRQSGRRPRQGESSQLRPSRTRSGAVLRQPRTEPGQGPHPRAGCRPRAPPEPDRAAPNWGVPHGPSHPDRARASFVARRGRADWTASAPAGSLHRAPPLTRVDPCLGSDRPQTSPRSRRSRPGRPGHPASARSPGAAHHAAPEQPFSLLGPAFRGFASGSTWGSAPVSWRRSGRPPGGRKVSLPDVSEIASRIAP